jgi:predicted nucleic acid-binding protein
MRLIVDANVLVSELLRPRGQVLIARASLRLSIAERVWEEAEYELRKRLVRRFAQDDTEIDKVEGFLAGALTLANERIAPVPTPIYDMHETVARSRLPRDPDDWHTVALAIATDAAIWTMDADFLGCGIATWTTDTLLAHLAYMEAE